jgi:S-DNA-T family DNA segregation ATPase FtsK/SpoIIIE
VTAILREGASVGIQVVVSGDRSLLTGRVASLVEHRLLLRLPDRSDYTAAGLKTKDVPDTMPDGRGLWADAGIETQIAVLTDAPAGAAQSAWVRDLADRLHAEEQAHDVAPTLRPFRLAALPAEVDAAPLLADIAPVPEGHVALAVGGDDLALHSLDACSTPVIIGGRARTGRTTALQFVACHASALGRDLLAFTPQANALSDQLGENAIVGLDHDLQDVVERVRQIPAGGVVLIDDAELLKNGPLEDELERLVHQARTRHWRVLLAGETDGMGSGFSGWIAEARKSRHGLLLSPQSRDDAEAINSPRLPASAVLPKVHPGRGMLVTPSGTLPVQVPWRPLQD